MVRIEYYSNINKIKNVHPAGKCLFCIAALLMVLQAEDFFLPAYVLFGMTIMMLCIGIPWRYLLRLYTLPASFIIIGSLTIAVNIGFGSIPGNYEIHWAGLFFSVSDGSLLAAALMMARAIAAVSCLYFCMLSTPIEDITELMIRMKMPVVLTEMMALIYRFLFVIWENAVTIHTAQACRLGNRGFKNSFRSFSLLLGSLLIRSLYRSRTMTNALISRGYNGKISFVSIEYTRPMRLFAFFAIYDFVLLMLLISI